MAKSNNAALGKAWTRNTHAKEMGAALTKAIERVTIEQRIEDPEGLLPVATLVMDDSFCFCIRDLNTSEQYWVRTFSVTGGDGVFAVMADEDDLEEINSGKWGW